MFSLKYSKQAEGPLVLHLEGNVHGGVNHVAVHLMGGVHN